MIISTQGSAPAGLRAPHSSQLSAPRGAHRFVRIETREDLEILRDLGVDLGQGYLLGRPEDAALN